MFRYLLFIMVGLLIGSAAIGQIQSRSFEAGLKDGAGISIIEKEMRLHLVRLPGDEQLEFHIDHTMDRNMDIKLNDADGKELLIDLDKKGDTWKVNLAKLQNGNYVLLIYDFDANKLARIKVTKDKK